MLFGHDGLFGGVHAADGRTVVVGLVAGADALQEGDLPGRLSVGWAQDVPVGGAAGVQQALELQRRHHVGVASPSELLGQLGVVGLVARGQDDGADLHLLDPLDHVVVNGVEATDVLTTQALGADAAGQTARSFRLGQFVGIAPGHFLETANPLLDR